MKTKYEDIVRGQYVGKSENPVMMNDLLAMACGEQTAPSSESGEKILLLAIDIQQDFMDNGALGVPGAIEDVRRLTRFIYDNIEKITDIAVSLDTHDPFQIFHPCWWVDAKGDNPPPFTAITAGDVAAGKWRATQKPVKSREYVENLEKAGKVLVIWPYHCLLGTTGCALENQFANMAYFHSALRKSPAIKLIKGQDPLSEMYGVIKPEYSADEYVNTEFLKRLERFDRIIVAGEAKSHCVLSSLAQICGHFEDRPEVTGRIVILEDCMSSIPGFEEATEEAFSGLKKRYGVDLVKSEGLKLG